MSRINIIPMTQELCHQYYQGYVESPTLYYDDNKKHFVYDAKDIDEYFAKQSSLNQPLFAIMLDEVIIGELKFFDVSTRRQHCSISLRLQKLEYCNQGYGTEALTWAIAYAKDVLKARRVNARIAENNAIARRVAKKLGLKVEKIEYHCVYYYLDLYDDFVKKPLRIVKATLELRREYYHDPAQANYDDVEWLDGQHGLQVAIGQMIFMLLVEDKPIGEMRIYMMSQERDDCMMDIGIAKKEYLNRGYGTEAIERALDFIKNKLEFGTAIIEISTRDTKLKHICEKIGFSKTQRNWNKELYEINLK